MMEIDSERDNNFKIMNAKMDTNGNNLAIKDK